MPDIEHPSPNKVYPRKFIEYLIILDTHWTIEYIRNLPEHEFAIHALLAEKRLSAKAYIDMAILRKPTL